MKFSFQKLAVTLAALALTGGAANAGYIVVGENNGVANAAEGITDGNLITSDVRWTRDNVYILGRCIIVDNGATLTIEPGTIIRGVTEVETEKGSEPSVLLIARGGKIVANGTAKDPITFTSLNDPHVTGGASTVPVSFVNVVGNVITSASIANSDYDPDGFEGDNAFSKASRWGGVVICGKAYVSQGTSASPDTTPADGIWDGHDAALTDATAQNNGIGTDYVEGLSTASGSTLHNSTRAIYGGIDDADNSGVMRFVSMRYGGFVVGSPVTGNEINGITICGAGTGSVFEWLEVFQNRDDGFEWFGGKHNARFLFSLSNQDDMFDGDEGFRGIFQFICGAQGTQSTSGTLTTPQRAGFTNNDYIGQEFTASDYSYDKLLEWDGGEGNDADRLPYTDLTVLNGTFLAGNTGKDGFNPKLEAQLRVHNSLAEAATEVNVCTLSGGGVINAALFWSNIHSNTYTNADSNVSTTGLTETAPVFAEETASQIASDWNESVNAGAGLATSDFYTKNGFDPRLAPGAAARTEDGTFATPTGFVDVDYAGCMLDNDFLGGWSMLEYLQILPTTNLARPVLTIGVSGANPTISWTSAGASIKYVVEKTSDGKTWTVLTATPVSGAGTLMHTDTTSTVGTAVHYRVYAL